LRKEDENVTGCRKKVFEHKEFAPLEKEVVPISKKNGGQYKV